VHCEEPSDPKLPHFWIFLLSSTLTSFPHKLRLPRKRYPLPVALRRRQPTPALGDDVGQILSDGHVMFRLLAPNAQSVSVVVVINSGELTTQMTQELFGLWTATLGPFKPDLYEYSFILDGVRIADPGNATPKPQWQVNTSLLLVPGTPLISWTHKMSRMELFAKRPTTRLRLANIAGCWSIPRPIMTVLLTPPFLSFTFTMAAGIRATRG
jgi:Carbohydrate-binding module 48 (Isoamylase N-terminal domain)